MYDTQTCGYVKFDGGPASLAAELEDFAKRSSSKDGGMASEEPDVIKQRIQQIATAENAPVINPQVRNEFRTRAVAEAAQARTYHAGAVIGPGLLIHGGQSRGDKQDTLSDWNLFDFGLTIWVEATCYEASADGNPSPFELSRKMHSLSCLVDSNI